MLDVAIKTQLKAYLERLQHAIELVATAGPYLIELSQGGQIDPGIRQLGAVAGP